MEGLLAPLAPPCAQLPQNLGSSSHDEAVRDLKRHLRAHLGDDEITFVRAISDPTTSVSSPHLVTASQLAVPGGFRRHHLCDRVFGGSLSSYPPLIKQVLDPHRTFPSIMDEDDACIYHSCVPEEGSSTAVTALVLVKTFLTGTILVLPKGFVTAGITGGCLALVLIGFLEVYCMQLLVTCRRHKGSGSYSELAESLGGYGPMILRAMLVASQYGFVCAEQLYVSSNALKVLQPLHPSLEQWHLLFIFQIILVPLCCFRKIKFFAVTNLIGDAFVIGCVAYLFGSAIWQLHVKGPCDQSNLLAPPSSIMMFMGTCVYVYEGINVVLPVYEAHERKDRFNLLLGAVLTTLTVVFVCFATLWYYVYGNRVEDVASLNLPDGSIEANLISSFYAIACLFTTPILFFPITQELEPVLFRRNDWQNVTSRKWCKNIFRACAMCLSACIAAVGGEHMQRFLSILGGMCCGPLAILLPAALHLRICEPKGLSRVFDFALVLIGACVTVLSTTIALLGT